MVGIVPLQSYGGYDYGFISGYQFLYRAAYTVDEKILSAREKQVLRLIDQGMMSKHIADMLSISIHTVSRHRQEIFKKLQVNNSIEACRVAKELHLL